MNTRNIKIIVFLGSKVLRLPRADNLVSRLSRQCGILNISQPYRPPRPVKGITSLFFFTLCVCFNSYSSLNIIFDLLTDQSERTDLCFVYCAVAKSVFVL
jgi:hypothetical protein